MSGLIKLWQSLGVIRTEGYSTWRAAHSRSRFPVPVAVRDGPVILVRPGDSDLTVVRNVYRDRQFEMPAGTLQERIHARYEDLLHQGLTPVIVDAGANIGASSLWFCDLFPSAAVVAIEPDPASADILRRNLADRQSAKVIEAAIGGVPGKVALIQTDASWAIRTQRSAAGCAVVTMAEALARVPNGSLFMVKIDIEGFESDLFAHATGWLDDAFVVFIEPHDWMLPGQRTSQNFQRAFAERDFDLIILNDQLVYIRHASPGPVS